MTILFILMAMIFAHIVDDYYLQGLLASLKQKDWWEENAPEEKYRYDFITALITHGLSWSFMVLLPIIWYYNFQVTTWMFIIFLGNGLIHASIDHLKANKKAINLTQDQLLHLAQIIITFTIVSEF